MEEYSSLTDLCLNSLPLSSLSLDELPQEILCIIMKYLEGQDFVNFISLSRLYNSLPDQKTWLLEKDRHFEKSTPSYLKTRYNLDLWDPTQGNSNRQSPLDHTIIVGDAESGKTSLIVHLLKNVLNNSLFRYYTPKNNDQVLDNSNITLGTIRKGSSLNNVLSEVQVIVDNRSQNIDNQNMVPLYIIIDGFEIDQHFWRSYCVSSIIYNGRHYKTYFIFAGVIFTNIPHGLRRNIGNFVLTSDRSPQELKYLEREYSAYVPPLVFENIKDITKGRKVFVVSVWPVTDNSGYWYKYDQENHKKHQSPITTCPSKKRKILHDQNEENEE